MNASLFFCFQPSSPMSPDFGKEDRKLKMKKKRKVPVKIKLKRNYSSEHWDTMSLPSTSQYAVMSVHHQTGTNSSKIGFLSNQHKDTGHQDSGNRFKDSSSLLSSSSHVNTQQTTMDNNMNPSGQNIMHTSGNYAPPMQSQPNFDNNPQDMQSVSQNQYLGSPQSFSWDDMTPSQNSKLQTVQERVQTNVPQMPAKFRLSSYHQNMYYNSQQASLSNNQTNQAQMNGANQENPGLFSGNHGNSMTTGYAMQNYDPIAENNYPERGLEQLLEKSNDGYSSINSGVQSAINNKVTDMTANGAVGNSVATSSMGKYARGNEYANEVCGTSTSESLKGTNTDTMSLTTINKDDLISEIDSLKRDHEESQAIERTKLKKKKKFFISTDVDSSITSPKDSPKFRILKKKYRHSFVKSVSEKVCLPEK